VAEPIKSNIVTPKAERDGAKPGGCAYCEQPVGYGHKENCLFLRRRIISQAKIRYVAEVPAAMKDTAYEDTLNSGRICSNQLLIDLKAMLETNDGCLCGCVRWEVVEEECGPFLNEEADGGEYRPVEGTNFVAPATDEIEKGIQDFLDDVAGDIEDDEPKES